MTTIKPIRCPRCRNLDIELIEHIDCASSWTPGQSIGYHITGSYYKVTGSCSRCSKNWRLRGYIQVNDDLRSRLDENDRLMMEA